MRFSIPEIPERNPFQNCSLGRRRFAESLTKVIEINENGLVMSLNNNWGSGKTTFILMWKKHLENSGYKTIYFNSWENDFEDNPLIAFISELKNKFKKNDTHYKSALEIASRISKEAIPIIIKKYVEKKLGEGALSEISEAISKGAMDSFEKNVNDYNERKESISEFRGILQKWVADNSNGKPLVFMIDELDRCRPNYSVQLLEQLKHLFSVPNIIFVISIDKVQLGYAIQGAYGSNQINSHEYLKRFIDLEYSLPEVPSKYFIENVFKKTGLNQILINRKFDVENDIQIKKHLIYLFDKLSVNLRTQEQIIGHLSIILKLDTKRNLQSDFFTFILFLKHFNSNLYYKIKEKKITIEDLNTEVTKIYQESIGFFEVNQLLNIESQIYLAYLNHINRYFNSDASPRLKEIKMSDWKTVSGRHKAFTEMIKSELETYDKFTPLLIFDLLDLIIVI